MILREPYPHRPGLRRRTELPLSIVTGCASRSAQCRLDGSCSNFSISLPCLFPFPGESENYGIVCVSQVFETQFPRSGPGLRVSWGPRPASGRPASRPGKG
jgi:hypothetical protein